MKIFPAIDLKAGKCVRLVQGDMDLETVYSENPVEKALEWEAAGAEVIHIVDLDGAVQGSPKNRESIEAICKNVKCEIQLGGGVRKIETADEYFDIGVSRIVLGSLLLKDPNTAAELATKYPQKIIAGIDVKDSNATADGWTTSTGLSGVDLVKSISDWPLGGVVFTDISKDGMMQGHNIEGLQEMAEATDLPLIASGGVTTMDDLRSIVKVKGVYGAIIGKALYTGAIDLKEAIGEFYC